MAGRIQGITVEIGGDTTKLSSALQGVNKEIKSTQSQLKDVEKLLKLDPSNTELLSQKQKLLTQAISETKEKLATLKTAAEQANEQLQKGEITQEQYDALQREIQETEQQLKQLETQASSTNATLAKIEEVGGKFEEVGGKITSVGSTLTKTVTAPIVGLGTAAVKTAADFDEGMSKVSAISGATGDDLDALRTKAREMGAKTKFSATEAASAFEYMAMAGWKTGDMVSGIDGIMSLAAASGEDLATTSDIVTDQTDFTGCGGTWKEEEIEKVVLEELIRRGKQATELLRSLKRDDYDVSGAKKEIADLKRELTSKYMAYVRKQTSQENYMAFQKEVRAKTAELEGRITVTRGSNEHLEEAEDALKPLADGSVAAEKNGLTQAMVQELVENVWVGDEITVEFKADSMMRIAEDELVG